MPTELRHAAVAPIFPGCLGCLHGASTPGVHTRPLVVAVGRPITNHIKVSRRMTSTFHWRHGERHGFRARARRQSLGWGPLVLPGCSLWALSWVPLGLFLAGFACGSSVGLLGSFGLVVLGSWSFCSGFLVAPGALVWLLWVSCSGFRGLLFCVPFPFLLCCAPACLPKGHLDISSCDILDFQCSLATWFQYSRPTSCNTVRVLCDISTPSCHEGSFLRCGCCTDRIVSLSVVKWRRSFCGALTGTTWPLGCQSHCCSRCSASGVANLRTRSCRGLQQCQPLWVGRVLGPCQCHWSL